MNKNETTLATMVKQAREKIGISQRELSRQTGIDNNTIAKIERGLRKKPNVLFLRKIARSLGLELEKLMELSGYSKDEYEIISNNNYYNMFIENEDSSYSTIYEVIKNQQYDIYVKNILLEFINSQEFKNSSEYRNLKSAEKKKVDKLFKDMVKDFKEDIKKMEQDIKNIDK